MNSKVVTVPSYHIDFGPTSELVATIRIDPCGRLQIELFHKDYQGLRGAIDLANLILKSKKIDKE